MRIVCITTLLWDTLYFVHGGNKYLYTVSFLRDSVFFHSLIQLCQMWGTMFFAFQPMVRMWSVFGLVSSCSVFRWRCNLASSHHLQVHLWNQRQLLSFRCKCVYFHVIIGGKEYTLYGESIIPLLFHYKSTISTVLGSVYVFMDHQIILT